MGRRHHDNGVELPRLVLYDARRSRLQPLATAGPAPPLEARVQGLGFRVQGPRCRVPIRIFSAGESVNSLPSVYFPFETAVHL
jgi:hypothetical protein